MFANSPVICRLSPEPSSGFQKKPKKTESRVSPFQIKMSSLQTNRSQPNRISKPYRKHHTLLSHRRSPNAEQQLWLWAPLLANGQRDVQNEIGRGRPNRRGSNPCKFLPPSSTIRSQLSTIPSKSLRRGRIQHAYKPNLTNAEYNRAR
jgi:hypothetical protein